MKPLINHFDRNGEALDAVDQSDSVTIVALSAATNAVVTIPAGSRYALFQNLNQAEPFYAKFDLPANVFAAVPTAGANQSLMINPDVRRIDIESGAGQANAIHLIAENATSVAINFYSY